MVDMKTGFCDCSARENMFLCNHQTACADFSKLLPQVFVFTPANRRWFTAVVVGDYKVPKESFSLGLLEPEMPTAVQKNQRNVQRKSSINDTDNDDGN